MEHLVIQTKTVITGLFGPDLHIFVDGRRSPRTRRAQIMRDWSDFRDKHERRDAHTEPIEPVYMYRLGVNDQTQHPVPFVPRNQFDWSVAPDWHLFAYKPFSHLEEGYVRLIHIPSKKLYHVSFDHSTDNRDWKTKVGITVKHDISNVPHDTMLHTVFESRHPDTKQAILAAIKHIEKNQEAAA